MTDFRPGRWEDALADVGEVDALITDPPYSDRTHGASIRESLRYDTSDLRAIPYTSWSGRDVANFVDAWAPRCRGWFVAMSDHVLQPAWERVLQAVGRYVFAPLPVVQRGMSVRLAGDGPSSWTIWLTVARPRSQDFARWGTLPGAYFPSKGPNGDRGLHIGGKPLSLMRALVRDYSRPGDLVCDPCAGAATTLLAAEIEGRRAVGAEVDPETFAAGLARLKQGHTPSLPFMEGA